MDFLPFTESDALEAARVQAELQSDATRIPIGDPLIAGGAQSRHHARLERWSLRTGRRVGGREQPVLTY
jgi:predicted nucleic acid-binding protein